MAVKQKPNATTLDDIFGLGGAARAASILTFEPTPEFLQSAGEAALKLGTSIAPNIYTPLGAGWSQEAWEDAVAVTPDDALARFWYELGRKDAGLWARLMGVGAGG